MPRGFEVSAVFTRTWLHGGVCQGDGGVWPGDGHGLEPRRASSPAQSPTNHPWGLQGGEAAINQAAGFICRAELRHTTLSSGFGSTKLCVFGAVGSIGPGGPWGGGEGKAALGAPAQSLLPTASPPTNCTGLCYSYSQSRFSLSQLNATFTSMQLSSPILLISL